MHVDVHMRYLLEGRRTDRMPQTHALIGERLIDRSGDLYQSTHQRRADSWTKLPYVVYVRPRHDQYMSGIVLARIDESDSQIILVDDIAGRTTRHDFAEDAFGVQVCLPRLKSL